jgi:hypothetical protein
VRNLAKLLARLRIPVQLVASSAMRYHHGVHRRWLSPLMILALAFELTSCSTSPHPTSPASCVLQKAGVLVSGRSPHPADIRAPGIQFSRGDLQVTVGNNHIVVTASNWNTIDGSSSVAKRVCTAFYGDFNTTSTTRNRFQYLADRIAGYRVTSFDPVGVVTAIDDGQRIAIVSLYNPLSHSRRLSGLSLTISAEPGGTTLASETFFSTPGSALLIPAHTIIFGRLRFATFTAAPSTTTSITYNFHYDSFVPVKT